jgi:tetracycline 7-halogenase / FADH2 O2-dependent halogenase
MPVDFDLAIVGSGFAGSLLALVGRRIGKSVLLLEKGAHPRFAIGESSSPLANVLLEEIATRWNLPRLRPLATWGAWRRAYPELACGLKRGFSFFHHADGLPFGNAPDRSDQLLVAASPNDEVGDTHWYRPDLDLFLVNEAAAAGVHYVDRAALGHVTRHEGGWRLEGGQSGHPFSFRARFLVDASGRDTALSSALECGSAGPEGPPRQALFTHFTGVRRFDERSGPASVGTPPYPVDDAAVHHVFPGGWIWVLRFSNGITSAGVAAEDALARELGLEEGGTAWTRLLNRLPSVGAQFETARVTRSFVHAPRLAFRRTRAAGPGWALLPSAAAFADPLLSTGFPLALLGVLRLAEALEEDFTTPRFGLRLAAYSALTLEEADRTARLVAALYSSFADFPLFVELSKLYFAAASFSESVRRLGRPGLAGSFLCGSHPTFGPALDAICRTAPGGREGTERAALLAEIARAVAILDVAGLGDASRRNWFPVEANDLRRGREKLGATAEEIESLVRDAFSPKAVSASSGS